MKKTKPDDAKDHVSVRLSSTQIERIDALAKRCSTKWRDETRSDVLRFLVMHSLELIEQDESLIVTEFHRIKGDGFTRK